jgi:hypothetical protein
MAEARTPTRSDAGLDAAAPAPDARVVPGGPMVGRSGTDFVYQGKALKLYGYTFYPAPVGGTAAWRRANFTDYLDSILDMAAAAGQNMPRPTDFWDDTGTGQSYEDPAIWKNMDYLIAATKKRGGFVLMDLSAYKWLLTAKGMQPYDPANWTTFLRFVAARYIDETAIAFYSIVGEPPPPKSRQEADALVTFYRAVTDELRAADRGRHLIAAGGFNHMPDEKADAPWWHPIFALPNNDVVAFKTYSKNDFNLIPTITAYAKQLGKPMCDQEFGMPQYLGDDTFSGMGYNAIDVSRAQFFDDVYTTGEKMGVTSFAFWNLGCQLKDTSYEVSPKTPAVWKVLQKHAAVPPIGTATCP